jgi:glycine/D-amino acid oxidase-like deaminating enzyme
MKDTKSFDVIIVGAGVIGCSIAYHLTAAGLKTALLDMGQVGAGASGANFGMVQSNDVELKHSIPLVTTSYTRFDHLEEELGMSFDFRRIATLSLMTKDEQRTAAEKRVKEMARSGIEAEIIPPSRIPEIEPLIDTHDLIGAIYCPSQAQLNPFRLMWAYLSAAISGGMALYTFTEVLGFDIQSGKVCGVHTTQGDFSAGTIVLATAAWTRPIGSLLGRNWNIHHSRGSVLVSEPVYDYHLRTIVSSADHIELPVTSQEDVELTVLALTQLQDGHFLIAQANRSGEELNATISLVAPKAMAMMAGRYFPMLRTARILRSWTAPSAFTDDGCPFIGPVQDLDGLILATAFRSSIINSPIAGEIVTQLVTLGRCDVLDLSPFSPERTLENADSYYKVKTPET